MSTKGLVWRKNVNDCHALLTGESPVVLLPKSTREISEIMVYCNKRILQCCVQAGNTSLVAGAVPYRNEIIISSSRMNQIESFDEASGILQCQSGCVLQTLESFVNERGYMMPYDLGAKGSCQIGGNVSTNAGGLHFLRYGSLHGSILGLEAVLPNGQILDLMKALRKDNTGYDLKQLFIGSEGTLGIVTKVGILCPLKPKSQIVAFLSSENFSDVLRAYQMVRRELNEYVSSFEMMDAESMNVVTENLELTNPLQRAAPFYILIELSSNYGEIIDEKLSLLLEKLMAEEVIVDGTYAGEPNKMQQLWAFRERIAEALLIDGYAYKYDVSLPLTKYYDLVEVMRERLKQAGTRRICGYGHLGDFNLHFNVTSPRFDASLLGLIEPFIYQFIADNNGSISAEHGLGLKKRNYIHYSRSQTAINIMKDMKKLFDPNGILNPCKVLPN